MFSPSPLNDDQPERCWRHLDTCQYQTILHASPPRTQCAQHGVMVVKLPWAEAGACFTALFEALAIDWMKAASQQAVADLLDLSWDEIHGIQERAVKRGLERRKREPIVHLGVDEKAFRKGHNYLTLVNDLGGSRVLYVPEDRQQGSLDGFWRTLTEEQTQGIQAVAMDMWDPYIDSVRDHLPEGDKKIVFDKFHIAKLSLLKTRSRQKRHEAQEPWRSWDLARGSRSNHGPPIDLVRSDDARRCRPFRPENPILKEGATACRKGTAKNLRSGRGELRRDDVCTSESSSDLVWKDTFIDGKLTRIRERVRLAPATLGEREVLKRAQKHLEPINYSLAAVGSATNFDYYVEWTYKPVVLALMAKTTKERYEGIIKDYLLPAFGSLCLGDLSVLTAQRYFSNTKNFAGLGHESIDKIRDVLSSVLRSAVEYGLIEKNPVENVRIPRAKSGKKAKKPHVTPEQFSQIIAGIPEPYATMVDVAVWTGLRVSELIGLRWEDMHTDSLTIDERYCRGDWSEPKSDASDATIGVDLHVIDRIERLKTLTVTVRAGRAKRKYRVVKSAKPHDLVFQSVKDGKPMRDNNILTRFIKPAARAAGLEWVNWRCLRTSRATWMIEAGANPKDVQGQMRHSRISTTMDIYAQFVPESARRAMDRTREMVERRTAAMQQLATQAVQ